MSVGPLVMPRRSFLRGLRPHGGWRRLGYYFPVEAQRPTNEPGKPPGPKPVTGSQGDRSGCSPGSTPMSSSMSVRTAP